MARKTTAGSSILGAIGNTPLVKIPLETQAGIYAKLEYLNPGGSIKDRPALYMIEDAEKHGLLHPGGTIIEASSGNQGIALAMIGAAKGYRVIITVSEKVSEEKKKTLTAYGAELIVCPATANHDDPQNYHKRAILLHKNTPNSFMPDQYFNTANPQSHYRTLGPEIWEQTNGTITHFIAAAGTGGTVSGAGRYLKECNPNVKVIAVDAANSFRSTRGRAKPYKIEGLGVDFDTPCLNATVIDEFIPVADKPAIDTLKVLAHRYGILAGSSSGAVAYATMQYLPKLKKDSVVVIVFPDSGRAYLSKNYF